MCITYFNLQIKYNQVMKKKIAILGSTGSIGKCLIDIIKNDKKNFEIIGSAHNLREIKIKERQGVGKIFLSPIFKKKRNNQLGIFRYLSLRKLSPMKDIALGGINNRNVKRFKLIKPFGFAGISYFK